MKIQTVLPYIPEGHSNPTSRDEEDDYGDPEVIAAPGVCVSVGRPVIAPVVSTWASAVSWCHLSEGLVL